MTNWLMAILQLLELSYFLIYSFLALKTTTGLLQGGKQIFKTLQFLFDFSNGSNSPGVKSSGRQTPHHYPEHQKMAANE